MTKTLLALAMDGALKGVLDPAAAQLGYAVEFADLPEEAVAFLVSRQPSLIVIELGQDIQAARSFVMAAKTSPATRKLPILAVSPGADPAVLLAAQQAGCDAAVSHQSFLADASNLISVHARADDSAELMRQAREPLPELAHTAIAQFNAREFFEQHETFEHLWRAEPGPIRQLYQGILQIGVAYLQIERKNYAGARKLFQRAWQYLSALPDVCQGIDMAQFKADAQTAQAELERLGPSRIGEFNPTLFKPIQMTKAASP